MLCYILLHFYNPLHDSCLHDSGYNNQSTEKSDMSTCLKFIEQYIQNKAQMSIREKISSALNHH